MRLYHSGHPMERSGSARSTSSSASLYMAETFDKHCWKAEKVRKFRWFSRRMKRFSSFVAEFLCSADEELMSNSDAYAVGERAIEHGLCPIRKWNELKHLFTVMDARGTGHAAARCVPHVKS